jgi:hypothetical protein
MNSADQLKSQEIARSVVYGCLAEAFRLPGPDRPRVLENLESSLGRLDSGARQEAAWLKRNVVDGALLITSVPNWSSCTFSSAMG